jgi:hypothetical protein
MTTYTNPYTGQTINPSQVGYESLTISSNTTLTWPINGTTTGNVVANIIEVTATAANLKLILPAATQVSNGQAIIIRNIGSGGNYAFNVVTNVANTVIVNIPVSASGTVSNTYYIYVTNNSTQDGTWSNIAMGIGTSSASASTLAGSGLTAINNTLNEATVVTTFSSSYSFVNNDRADLYTWTGGSGTATLPNPIAGTGGVGAGWFVIIKNNGTGVLTVAVAGGSTKIDPTSSGASPIGGTATVQVQIANSSVFVTDGYNWFTYALAQTNVFNYTQYVAAVDSIVSSPFVVSQTNAKSVIQQYQGVLGLNLTVLLPQTVQLYSLRNITTGSYSLTFGISNNAGTAALGTTITVPANQTIIAISDGTNLYNANSATSSYIATLSVSNGSAANPSITFQSDLTSGLYLVASGQLGLAISGVDVGTLTSSGFVIPVGINAGAF